MTSWGGMEIVYYFLLLKRRRFYSDVESAFPLVLLSSHLLPWVFIAPAFFARVSILPEVSTILPMRTACGNCESTSSQSCFPYPFPLSVFKTYNQSNRTFS